MKKLQRFNRFLLLWVFKTNVRQLHYGAALLTVTDL
jgi:hypothetical protein